MELVAVSVACTQALIALTWLVERVEVHNQVKLVVRSVRHPCKGVGVVSARFIQDCKRLAMTGCRDSLREDQGNHHRQANCD